MPFLTFYVKLSWKKNLKNSAALNWMDSVVKSEAGKARVQRRLCLWSHRADAQDRSAVSCWPYNMQGRKMGGCMDKISDLAIAGMLFSLLFSFGCPIVLLLRGISKKQGRISDFLIGFFTFFIIVVLVERIFHNLVFRMTGLVLLKMPLLYALYGGAAAALFEESARLLIMGRLLKKRGPENAFMYGVGHGGAEAMITVGMISLNNLVLSFMINAGSIQSILKGLEGKALDQTLAVIRALQTAPKYGFFVGGVERGFAMVFHICASILMYASVKKKKKSGIVLVYFLHFIMDFLAVYLNKTLGLFAAEGYMLVFALVLGICTFQTYRGLQSCSQEAGAA